MFGSVDGSPILPSGWHSEMIARRIAATGVVLGARPRTQDEEETGELVGVFCDMPLVERSWAAPQHLGATYGGNFFFSPGRMTTSRVDWGREWCASPKTHPGASSRGTDPIWGSDSGPSATSVELVALRSVERSRQQWKTRNSLSPAVPGEVV